MDILQPAPSSFGEISEKLLASNLVPGCVHGVSNRACDLRASAGGHPPDAQLSGTPDECVGTADQRAGRRPAKNDGRPLQRVAGWHGAVYRAAYSNRQQRRL